MLALNFRLHYNLGRLREVKNLIEIILIISSRAEVPTQISSFESLLFPITLITHMGLTQWELPLGGGKRAEGGALLQDEGLLGQVPGALVQQCGSMRLAWIAKAVARQDTTEPAS